MNSFRAFFSLLLASLVFCCAGPAGAYDRGALPQWMTTAAAKNRLYQPTSTITRAFSIDLNGDGIMDTVYLERMEGALHVCYGGGEAPQCAVFSIKATDVLPLSMPDDTQGLLILGQAAAKHCKLDGPGSDLRCASSDLFGADLQRSSDESSVVKGEKTSPLPTHVQVIPSHGQSSTCAVLDNGEVHCSASRRLGTSRLLIGDFGGNGLEMIRLEGGPTVCRLKDGNTSDCAGAPELANLLAATELASVKLDPRAHSAIVGVGRDAITMCARPLNTDQFICRTQSVSPSINGAQGWITAKIANQTFAETLTFAPTSRVVPAAVEGANAAKRVAYTLEQSLIADLGLGTLAQAKNLDDWSRLLPDGNGGGYYFEVPGQDCWDWGGGQQCEWTDAWGSWYWDVQTPKPSQCVQTCQNEYNQGVNDCYLLSGLACGGVSVGATIVFGVTTGFVAGWAAGTWSFGTCDVLAASICTAAARNRYEWCMQGC